LCSATYGVEFGCSVNKKSEGAHGSHAGAVGSTTNTSIRFPIIRFASVFIMELLDAPP
jgi:hypothetical protein